MTVAVVTDSAASLPADLADRHDVTVVPLWLHLGDRAVPEDTCDLDDVLGAPVVTTAGPSPGELARAIEAAHQDHEQVLILTIAASFSSTHQSARLAAREVDPGGRWARVLDTTTAAGAEGLVVLAAAEAAQAGAPLADVEAAARRVMARVHLVAMLPSLDHLVRGGRVPEVAGWAGRRLGIAPLFAFDRGRVRKLRPARHPGTALERIVHRWEASRPPGSVGHVAVLHAADPESAAILVKAVDTHPAVASAFVGEFGAAMVAHVGPGLAGLAWWWDEGA